MTLTSFFAGLAVGLGSGFTSGLFGVSPGGGLVVFSTLWLGLDQHDAQGTSLIAQLPPTSLAALNRYVREGDGGVVRKMIPLAAGYFCGGPLGAYGALGVDDRALRWAYLTYLALLAGFMTKSAVGRRGRAEPLSSEPRASALFGIGLIAGFSSGFLGIGGGLATTVGLRAMRMAQRRAQMMSLALSLLPATAPSAWVYWSKGQSASWPALVGVIFGLAVAADVGARAAHQVSDRVLEIASIFFVVAMAAFLLAKALS